MKIEENYGSGERDRISVVNIPGHSGSDQRARCFSRVEDCNAARVASCRTVYYAATVRVTIIEVEEEGGGGEEREERKKERGRKRENGREGANLKIITAVGIYMSIKRRKRRR